MFPSRKHQANIISGDIFILIIIFNVTFAVVQDANAPSEPASKRRKSEEHGADNPVKDDTIVSSSAEPAASQSKDCLITPLPSSVTLPHDQQPSDNPASTIQSNCDDNVNADKNSPTTESNDTAETTILTAHPVTADSVTADPVAAESSDSKQTSTAEKKWQLPPHLIDRKAAKDYMESTKFDT